MPTLTEGSLEFTIHSGVSETLEHFGVIFIAFSTGLGKPSSYRKLQKAADATKLEENLQEGGC